MYMTAPADRGLWTVALIGFFVVVVTALVVDQALKGGLAGLASLALAAIFPGSLLLVIRPAFRLSGPHDRLGTRSAAAAARAA
jgi:undecaprenyl pyrophosphate phosphatase UppP